MLLWSSLFVWAQDEPQVKQETTPEQIQGYLAERVRVPGANVVHGSGIERGGVVPHWRAIRDAKGRMKVAISFNQDLGDGWEFADEPYYPERFSTEAIRVFLARDLTPVEGGRPFTGEAEEAHLPRAWVPLDDARDLVQSGAIGSLTAVSGIQAAWIERARGWSGLRPGDAPWPARTHLQRHDRVRRMGVRS